MPNPLLKFQEWICVKAEPQKSITTTMSKSSNIGAAIAAWRDGRRFEQGLERVALADDGMAAIPQGAVCLITGGFGGIGQAIARELARGLRVRARWPDRYRQPVIRQTAPCPASSSASTRSSSATIGVASAGTHRRSGARGSPLAILEPRHLRAFQHFSISWVMGLTKPMFELFGHGFRVVI